MQRIPPGPQFLDFQSQPGFFGVILNILPPLSEPHLFLL